MAQWITPADLQAALGADRVTLEDADILATDATDAIATYLNRDLARVETAIEYYDSNGTDYILLNNWPVFSLGGVTFNRLPIPPAAPDKPGWRFDPFNDRKLYLGQGRLPRGGIMTIVLLDQVIGFDLTQPAGSPTGLPGHIRRALLLTATAIYNSQAADPNLSSESIAGVFSGSFYPTGVGAVPPGARSLLSNELRVAA